MINENEVPKIKSSLMFEQLMSNGMLRRMLQYGAYDFRDHPRNFGIHNAEQEFVLSRSDCAVSFLINTKWYLPKNRRKEPGEYYTSFNWHSPVAQYEGHEVAHCNCEYTGGVCFGNYSGLFGSSMMELFISDPEAFWLEMEKELEKLEFRVAEEKANERNFS